jgi:hypothetical protein
MHKHIIGITIVRLIVKLVARFELSFRALASPGVRSVSLATKGAVTDRHGALGVFKALFKGMRNSLSDAATREGLIAHATSIDGWVDRRGRRFMAARVRGMSGALAARVYLLGITSVDAPRENAAAVSRIKRYMKQKLVQAESTVQIMTDGASAYAEGIADGAQGIVALICFCHEFQLGTRDFWRRMPARGHPGRHVIPGQVSFLSELTEVRRVFENSIISNYHARAGEMFI